MLVTILSFFEILLRVSLPRPRSSGNQSICHCLDVQAPLVKFCHSVKKSLNVIEAKPREHWSKIPCSCSSKERW